MKKLFASLFTLALLSLGANQAFAQGPPVGGVEPLEPTAVPIDGGASLLLAGGVAFGLKKLRQRRAR